ncbi:TerC family protein [Propylenella binzhouense]|uniref:TerC family protein n=1 Tax=Propylenella binzhouense TaxID=2555902 RepID=A0A964T5J8_9HYPH|nr:TerC family protein [Propylenella binzhouense]MYZ48926.1 TerC family protein [Propylenella binzhouense]
MSAELSAEVFAFLQVLLINVVLSGDNAIVVGMAAAGAPDAIRKKVIFYGILGAVVLRLLMAAVAVEMLHVVGLIFAGGLLLLWVTWKFYRELRQQRAEHAGVEAIENDLDAEEASAVPKKTFAAAMRQIIFADVSMSLDNVLAVAGAAHEHPYVLGLGLLLSVALMGFAATLVARLLDRYHWLAWVGLLIIFYVALEMIWQGGFQIADAVAHWSEAPVPAQ